MGGGQAWRLGQGSLGTRRSVPLGFGSGDKCVCGGGASLVSQLVPGPQRRGDCWQGPLSPPPAAPWCWPQNRCPRSSSACSPPRAAEPFPAADAESLQAPPKPRGGPAGLGAEGAGGEREGSGAGPGGAGVRGGGRCGRGPRRC